MLVIGQLNQWLSQVFAINFFQVREVGKKFGIVPTIIRDQELEARGFGGIYGVGKGALHPPALAVLSHCPQGATMNIAWVGKGIVYDTGGLSIKVIYELRYIKGHILTSFYDRLIPTVNVFNLLSIQLGKNSHARNEKRLWRSCWNSWRFLCSC